MKKKFGLFIVQNVIWIFALIVYVNKFNKIKIIYIYEKKTNKNKKIIFLIIKIIN